MMCVYYRLRDRRVIPAGSRAEVAAFVRAEGYRVIAVAAAHGRIELTAPYWMANVFDMSSQQMLRKRD